MASSTGAPLCLRSLRAPSLGLTSAFNSPTLLSKQHAPSVSIPVSHNLARELTLTWLTRAGAPRREGALTARWRSRRGTLQSQGSLRKKRES